MKNNSSLDDHIKKQFSNYSPDVPPHIWESITAGKEKRRPVGFWVNFFKKNGLFLLLAIIIAGGSIMIYKNNHVQPPANMADANHQINNEPGKTNRVKAASTNKINTDQPAETINNISPNNNNTNTKKDIDLPGENSIVSDRNNSIAKNEPGAPGKNIVTVSGNLDKDLNIQSAIKNDKNNKPAFKRFRYTKGKTSANITIPTDESDDIISEDPAATSIPATDEILLKRMLLDVTLLQTGKNETLSINKLNIASVNIPCPRKEAIGKNRYLEIYGGPDYAFRSMSDTGNSTYLEKRKESSKFSSAFSAGLRYTKVFNNGMSFRTGINYSQINEKFKYAQGNIIQVIYITNSNGDTTGSYTSSGTRYKTTYNKFRMIDVPVLIGYELGNGRLHFNLNAGAIVNIYSWQKGDVLDTAYNPVNITTGKSSSPYQFRTNAGLGFMGAVSIYYRLGERLHFLAEPYFRYNISPASKSELTFKQKYNTAGLRLGLRFDF